jgi:hypothetical protein
MLVVVVVVVVVIVVVLLLTAVAVVVLQAGKSNFICLNLPIQICLNSLSKI